MFMHLLMYFFCPYSGYEQYLGFSHSEFMFHPMVYSWLISTLHFADKSREAAVLLSFVSLINDADTEHTQCTLSDYSRQLLLSNISEKHKKSTCIKSCVKLHIV